MSITVNNIISPNIIRLQNIVTSQSSQLQQLIDLYSDKNKRSYDQTTKQNVSSISFDQSTQLYRFEIENKENEVFIYQVWKKDNSTLNSDRKYVYISLKSWINEFQAQLNFTPTTLIEINNIFYPTVMVDAVIEQNKCVFYFDSRSIKGSVVSLPQNGSYNNVRFDIDNLNNNDCLPTTQLSPLILHYIPTPIYNNENGMIITTNQNYTNIYAYISKDCEVKPITLVMTSYCNIIINDSSVLGSLTIPITIPTPLIISNLFLSMNIFIDCDTYIMSVEDLYVNISNGNAVNGTQYLKTTSNNQLLDYILKNNSQDIVFKTPGINFDINTSGDQSTALVRLLNTYIKQNKSVFPSVDLHNNSNAVLAINIVCGK